MFFDAGAEPSSPSFMARAPEQASSTQSSELSFADASSSTASRAGSFKDAPGPSELWEVSSTGDYRFPSLFPEFEASLPSELHALRSLDMPSPIHCAAIVGKSSATLWGSARVLVSGGLRRYSGTASGGKAAETAPAKKDSAWILDFDSWAQGSSGYAGVDSEMRMRLKTLYFACNRPTIGALIALGSDFGAAFSSGKPEV